MHAENFTTFEKVLFCGKCHFNQLLYTLQLGCISTQYHIVQIAGQTKKSEVVKGELNPVWNQVSDIFFFMILTAGFQVSLIMLLDLLGKILGIQS